MRSSSRSYNTGNISRTLTEIDNKPGVAPNFFRVVEDSETTNPKPEEWGARRLAGSPWIASRLEECLEKTPAVRDLEPQLRDLFHHTTDLIQSVSPDGRLLFVNQAWIDTLGYSLQEIRTLTIFDILHPEKVAEYKAMFGEMADGSAPLQLETIFVNKAGDLIDVEGNASFRFENGVAVSIGGIFRDITKRKQIERERDALIARLESSVAQVEALSRLLPVCSWCENIRIEEGKWETVAQFLMQHPDVTITHTICPCCVEKVQAGQSSKAPHRCGTDARQD